MVDLLAQIGMFRRLNFFPSSDLTLSYKKRPLFLLYYIIGPFFDIPKYHIAKQIFI